MADTPVTPPDGPPPPELRLIKRLVVVLTSVMILGLLVIIGLLVTRLGMAPAPVALPAEITLPQDARPEAITLSQDWVIVLTRAGEVLFYTRRTGDLRHTLTLPPQ
jgi:hypothetical protein